MTRTPAIMAPASGPFSAQSRAEYPGQIRSRNCSHCRFLPVTTHCMHRLSRCCVAPAAMCCTARPPRMRRRTGGFAAGGHAHFGCRLQSSLILHGACEARTRRTGRSHTEAHTQGEHFLPTVCCSGLQTLRTAPRSVCHSRQTLRPNRPIGRFTTRLVNSR